MTVEIERSVAINVGYHLRSGMLIERAWDPSLALVEHKEVDSQSQFLKTSLANIFSLGYRKVRLLAC
jgi:hypothetical protein